MKWRSFTGVKITRQQPALGAVMTTANNRCVRVWTQSQHVLHSDANINEMRSAGTTGARYGHLAMTNSMTLYTVHKQPLDSLVHTHTVWTRQDYKQVLCLCLASKRASRQRYRLLTRHDDMMPTATQWPPCTVTLLVRTGHLLRALPSTM